MNWIVIAILIGAGVTIWGVSADRWHGEGRILTGLIIGSLAALVGIAAVIEWWGFQPKMAELAQIRSAVERLGCGASEDVIGKAADWNATIVNARIWNRRWLGDPFYNDGIDTVTTVVIPECK
jgi:hypothetical protein